MREGVHQMSDRSDSFDIVAVIQSYIKKPKSDMSDSGKEMPPSVLQLIAVPLRWKMDLWDMG